MKIEPKKIIDGWFNLALSKFKLLSEQKQLNAEARFTHCNSCKMRDGNVCSPARTLPHVITKIQTPGCGCNLSAKVMSGKSECPIGLW